jgi:hypothetical protein
MAAPFVVACTHCGSKLKLKDASFAGKKVRCPKCQEPFTVPRPKRQKAAAPPDSSEFLAHISEEDYGPPPGEEEDEFDALPESPLQRKKTAAKTKGKKKPKRRASSAPPIGKIALIAMLVLVGISALGGGVFGIIYLIKNMGGAASRMAWLPENTEMVVEIRVSDVWNSQALQPITGGEIGQKIADGLKSQAKVDLQDIERVVVGGAADAKTPIVVIYAKQPIDIETLKGDATPSDYSGYTLYRHGSTGAVGFLPSPEMVVYGPEDQVKGAIDRKGVCPVADKFDFVPSGDIVFATINPGRMGAGGPGMNLSDFDSNSITAIAASLDFSANIDASFTLRCADAAAAERLSGEMRTSMDGAKANLQQQKSQLQPNPFMDVEKLRVMIERQEQIIETMSIAQSGSNVNGSVSVPGTIIQDAVDTLGPMLPMMMQSLPGARTPSFTPPAPSPSGSPSMRSSAPTPGPGAHGEGGSPAGAHGEGSSPAGGHDEASSAGAHAESP